jgi:tRNA 2-thiouridine synthesizing protein A
MRRKSSAPGLQCRRKMHNKNVIIKKITCVEEIMAAADDKSPYETLDVLGRAIPYPLYLTKKKMEQLGQGETLRVLCDAPESAEGSIPRYAAKMGYSIEINKLPDMWELLLRKM